MKHRTAYTARAPRCEYTYTAGNWTFHPFVSSPPSLIERFLLIPLKPKHHRLDVLTIFQCGVRGVRGAVFDTGVTKQPVRDIHHLMWLDWVRCSPNCIWSYALISHTGLLSLVIVTIHVQLLQEVVTRGTAIAETVRHRQNCDKAEKHSSSWISVQSRVQRIT